MVSIAHTFISGHPSFLATLGNCGCSTPPALLSSAGLLRSHAGGGTVCKIATLRDSRTYIFCTATCSQLPEVGGHWLRPMALLGGASELSSSISRHQHSRQLNARPSRAYAHVLKPRRCCHSQRITVQDLGVTLRLADTAVGAVGTLCALRCGGDARGPVRVGTTENVVQPIFPKHK